MNSCRQMVGLIWQQSKAIISLIRRQAAQAESLWATPRGICTETILLKPKAGFPFGSFLTHDSLTLGFVVKTIMGLTNKTTQMNPANIS